MPRAARIPEPDELLCESCGYTLTGLDPAANCPECGRPLAESLPERRSAPPWELGRGLRRVTGFMTTAVRALFTPGVFFRRLAVRPPGLPTNGPYYAAWFGMTMRVLAGAMMGLAAALHTSRFGSFFDLSTWVRSINGLRILGALLGVVAILSLNWAVYRLTAWEAAYRGLRLPLSVVGRALDYHAVHLLVPAGLVLAVTGGYVIAERRDYVFAAELAVPYIYTLAGVIVLGSLYLFRTYWAAMRNLIYAN